MSLRERCLREYLGLLDVPLEQWGTGKAKTIAHLLRELRYRECSLNGIVRTIHTAILDIRYDDCQLQEICQVFGDGRIRERRDLPGEKLHVGERPILGFRRCLREEMGIRLGRSYADVHSLGGDVTFLPSTSYPGLMTRNIRTQFSYELPKEFYRPDGYFENQSDKTTYFDWVPINNTE